MLFHRVPIVRPDSLVDSIEGDISNGQTVDDLRKGEEGEFGGEGVIQGANEDGLVVRRHVPIKWDALAIGKSRGIFQLLHDPLDLLRCEKDIVRRTARRCEHAFHCWISSGSEMESKRRRP